MASIGPSSPSRPQALNFSGTGGPSIMPLSPKQRFSPALHANIVAIQDTFNAELLQDKISSAQKSKIVSTRLSKSGYRTPERGRATQMDSHWNRNLMLNNTEETAMETGKHGSP